MAHGKRFRMQHQKVQRDRLYPPAEAIAVIKEAIRIPKGSGEPHVKKVGTITPEQIRAIAERKMPDLNANDLDAASKIIAGTARSMGVDVK